jgi:hypothetical protein
MAEDFSNNATPKYLGYVYQVLIAIEQCFQAKKNETIWIECRGDVYDGSTSTEVKHHFENTNLTNNSVDFWKTLKNLVTEDISCFNSLILHTTANIQKNSIFYGWNELSNTEKYTKLKNHSPADTIKDDYDVSITNYEEKDLLPILEKLRIKSSQLNVKDKWEQLKESQIFFLIDDRYKDEALEWVYGHINRHAINDRHNWHIKINDFESACKFALRRFMQDKINFYNTRKSEVSCDSKNFLFVKEMENIKLRETTIELAKSDYLRANTSQIKILEVQPTMSEILDKYDNSVLEAVGSLKDEHSEKLGKPELDTEKAIETAKSMYFDSLKLPLINIPEVNNTEKYYQNGRIHHNVNEGNFVWKFCEDDLR